VAVSEAEKPRNKKQRGSRVKNARMVEEGYTRCAKEGEMCQCEGQVTYLVDHDDYHVVEPTHNFGVPQFNQLVNGQISCTNGIFGDPKTGVAKHCICQNPPYEQNFGLGKVKAHEGEEIDCVGTVLYGHSHTGW
jgi:hypothetical protein